MKWYVWIICIIIIVTGTFLAIDGYKLLSAKSATYGKYEYISNEQKEIFNEKLTALVFETQNDKEYTASKDFDVCEFDGTKGNFEILVNGLPCFSNEVSSGEIVGAFKLDFRNTKNEITSSVNLNIKISFLATRTVIEFTTIDVNNSVLMLEEYIANNGLSIKIVENLEVKK